MAFYGNPYYGVVPGAPQGVHQWFGPEFRMSDLMATLPPAAPVAPPLAATPTPQDVATRQGAVSLTDAGGGGGSGTGGSQVGSASGGSGPQGAYGNAATPYYDYGGATGRDTSNSGYRGVYADPLNVDSRFGQAGGLLGTATPYPGAGTALGTAGSVVDALRLGGALDQAGVPHNISPWTAAGYGLLSSVGVPFTDYNLARAFGVASPQQQYTRAVNAFDPYNTSQPVFGAIQANEPQAPGAPFGQTGWGPGMDPTRGAYPASFVEANPQMFDGSLAATPAAPPAAPVSQQELDAFAASVFGGGGEAAPAPDAPSSPDPSFAGGYDAGYGGMSGAEGGTYGWAKGGLIGLPLSRGRAQPGLPVDPPGPDDTMIPAQVGEGVLTKAAVKRYPGLLDAANAGKLNPKRVKGLLGATPAKATRRLR